MGDDADPRGDGGLRDCGAGLATRSGDAPDAACWRRWAVIVPFGVYAGWTACATFVNIAEVAPGLGWDRFGMSTVAYGVVSIAAAGAISALVLWWTRGELAFLATVVWALIAIIVAARLRGHAPAIVVAAAFTIVAVVIVAITVSAERLRIRRPG
ncbi:MAG: hypothetical protein SFX73_12265 [Kofleriaceae bacterium]|nr:hypothetical protein [Kofleriaceae bacterium]